MILYYLLIIGCKRCRTNVGLVCMLVAAFDDDVFQGDDSSSASPAPLATYPSFFGADASFVEAEVVAAHMDHSIAPFRGYEYWFRYQTKWETRSVKIKVIATTQIETQNKKWCKKRKTFHVKKW